MTAPDDLIRRGDAERAAISYHPADGSCCHEDPTGHHAAVWACDGIAERIRALPADPVAEAAVRFAGVIDRAQRQLVTGKPIRLYGLSGPEGEAALDAYRAAVAARAKETR